MVFSSHGPTKCSLTSAWVPPSRFPQTPLLPAPQIRCGYTATRTEGTAGGGGTGRRRRRPLCGDSPATPFPLPCLSQLLQGGQGKPNNKVPQILAKLQDYAEETASPSDFRKLLSTVKILAEVVAEAGTALKPSALKVRAPSLSRCQLSSGGGDSSLWALPPVCHHPGQPGAMPGERAVLETHGNGKEGKRRECGGVRVHTHMGLSHLHMLTCAHTHGPA